MPDEPGHGRQLRPGPGGAQRLHAAVQSRDRRADPRALEALVHEAVSTATDARRDQATLAAIGAPSGLRRATTAGQVFVITFMGTLLGSAISVIGIIAITWTQPMHAGFGPVIPWPHLAAFVLGLPLAGALLTWLVMPPGKPTAQRLA